MSRSILRTTVWRLGFLAGLLQGAAQWAASDAVRRFNSEPTEREALGLFAIGVPVGLLLIWLAVHDGFGYQPW